MSVEMMSYTGVVLTLNDVLSSLMPKMSQASCLEVVTRAKQALNEHLFKTYKGSDLLSISTALMIERLQEINQVSQFKEWLRGVFQNCASDVGDGALLDNEDELLLVWKLLSEIPEFLDLPEHVDFYYFNSHRVSGGDVPSCEILVVFEESSLFEQRLSKEGEKLAALLDQKSLFISSFCRMSY